MTDITSWIEDTNREIGSQETPEGEARVVRMRRRYDAPIEDVWDACTDPDRIVRWFLPVSGDLREGGRYSLEGNASGEIVRCAPPRLLKLTWEYGGGSSDVEVRLSPGGDGETVIDLAHGPVPKTVEVDGRQLDIVLNDDETGVWGLGTGWEMGLYALDAYLRGEMPDGPAAENFDENDPEMLALGKRMGQAWEAVVKAEGTTPPTTTSTDDGH